MIHLRSLTFASLILLAACSHPVPRRRSMCSTRVSSITPRAEHAAENAILDQISRMGRGDRLIVIPITGDAENDAGGRILRLVAPTERQAYDNDIRTFQADAKSNTPPGSRPSIRTRCGPIFWVPWILPGKNLRRFRGIRTAASSF